MPAIKTSDLPDLVGKSIIVQVEIIGSDDEDYREVRGKCVAANEGGVVVQTRSTAEIIKLSHIIDIDIELKSRRLVRRWIDPIDPEGIRQHLIDRHGMIFDMVRGIDVPNSVLMHAAVNHVILGHEHGPKPARSDRRTYVRPVD